MTDLIHQIPKTAKPNPGGSLSRSINAMHASNAKKQQTERIEHETETPTRLSPRDRLGVHIVDAHLVQHRLQFHNARLQCSLVRRKRSGGRLLCDPHV